ncbi:hypothetical protein [Nonomuraea dietziae]|uniref:hypothetical protein n=1 Tax=Nonomuraea dietziae TaxID=65515 RepID=UPI0031E0AFCB
MEAFKERVREGLIEVTALAVPVAHTRRARRTELYRPAALHRGAADPLGDAHRRARRGPSGWSTRAERAPASRYLAGAAHNWAGGRCRNLPGGDKLTARPSVCARPQRQLSLLVWFESTRPSTAWHYMEGNTVGLADSFELADDLLPALPVAPSRARGYTRTVPAPSAGQGAPTPTGRPTSSTPCTCGSRERTPTTPGPRSSPASIVREWNTRWAFPPAALGDQQRLLRARRGALPRPLLARTRG